jgi:hypothetical protein
MLSNNFPEKVRLVAERDVLVRSEQRTSKRTVEGRSVTTTITAKTFKTERVYVSAN